MSNLVWSWRNAAFGALISSVAVVVILFGEVENGLYLLIGAIPAAILGLPPRRKRPTESDGHRSALRSVRDGRFRPGSMGAGRRRRDVPDGARRRPPRNTKEYSGTRSSRSVFRWRRPA